MEKNQGVTTAACCVAIDELRSEKPGNLSCSVILPHSILDQRNVALNEMFSLRATRLPELSVHATSKRNKWRKSGKGRTVLDCARAPRSRRCGRELSVKPCVAKKGNSLQDKSRSFLEPSRKSNSQRRPAHRCSQYSSLDTSPVLKLNGSHGTLRRVACSESQPYSGFVLVLQGQLFGRQPWVADDQVAKQTTVSSLQSKQATNASSMTSERIHRNVWHNTGLEQT